MHSCKRACLLITIMVMAGSCSSTAGQLLGVAVTGSAVASAGVNSPSGGKPENTATPIRERNLSACTRGDESANLAIVGAFEQSMHELVVCGGMAQRFSMSFFNVFINLARRSKTEPSGFKHVGNGRYAVGDVMMVSMQLPFETSFGVAGDVIGFDVFDPKNYFTDAKIALRATASTSGKTQAELSVSFKERGPGLELLGDIVQGNQFTINFDALVQALGQIKLRQEIGVSDERGDATVVYHAVSDGVPIRNLVFAAAGAPITINDATVTNDKLKQVLTVTDWGMEFSGGSAGTMDGYVTFEVHGGDFDWAGKFVYPHRKTPDVILSCP